MEKRLQLWSPVNGWFVTEEGEVIALKKADLLLYETTVQEALEQEKLWGFWDLTDPGKQR